MSLPRIALAIGALLLAAAAHAAPNVVVEAVQYPAWLERAGRAVPLTPGTELTGRDRVLTGANARVLLRLAEGSTVKLGENARFAIEKAESRGVFTAAMSVLAGAFRFTTDPREKGGRRDVAIRVRNVSAGVRGTDLWGKSTEERDLVCLIEGRITVGAEGHPTLTLDQPLDFYQKPRGKDPELAKVDPKQLAEWAKETEPAADGPVGRVGGRWRVVAATFPGRDAALALNRTLRENGYPSEVLGKDPGPYIVHLSGLAGEVEARALMANLRGVKGVSVPSVHPIPGAAP